MIEKKIKKHILGPRFSAVLVTAHIFEDDVKKACERILERSLLFSGFSPFITVHDLKYREILALTIRCTLIQDIFWVFEQKKVDKAARFRSLIEKAPFDLILKKGAFFGLKIRSFNSHLYHEGRLKEDATKVLLARGYASKNYKDAENRILITLRDNTASLAISMAGASLYKRGYRKTHKATAPMAEHLAASLIEKAALFKEESWNIYVPFAGTGTLGFEALISCYHLGNQWQRRYSFEDFVCAQEKTADFLRKKLSLRALQIPAAEILFVDSDEKAALVLKENSVSFMVPFKKDSLKIRVERKDVLKGVTLSFLDNKKPLFIPINPPWGERLFTADLYGLYSKIGGHIDALSETKISGFIVGPDGASVEGFSRALSVKYKKQVFTFENGGSKRWCLFFTKE